MNWFKKAQKIMLESKWNRFAITYPGVPWKNVFEMKIGNPTKEELEKIKSLGLYYEIINPNDKNIFPDLNYH